MEQRRDREARAKSVPVKVKSFLEDIKGMDITHAKALLQTIVKSVYIWRDGQIEVEFR
ncbi:MAG: hypothetical protein O2783_02150 [Chloroflexi bacterium]|nr:hypothetical protein [Chloroflexota bacterium]